MKFKLLFNFFMMLGILISLASALNFDNVKTYSKATNEITITNAYGLGSDLAKYKLTKSENSIIDAYAEGYVTLYSDGPLFENLKFIATDRKERTLQYSIYYYSYEDVEFNDPVYGEVCEAVKGTVNGSQKCINQIIEYKKVIRNVEVRHEYKFGTILKAGTYKWRIEAKLPRPNYAIDWQVEVLGQTLSEWSWWAGDGNTYTKKRQITVTELSGKDLYNYTVLLKITYDSDMQTDFDDLRFTDSTETTELKYWIEQKNDSSMASVFVKVPYLAASSGTNIYMYYGNAGVSTTGNISQAFLFGDDFEDGSYTDRWSGSGTWYETGGTIYQGGADGASYQLSAPYDTNRNWSKGILESAFAPTTSYLFGYVSVKSNTGTNFTSAGFGYADMRVGLINGDGNALLDNTQTGKAYWGSYYNSTNRWRVRFNEDIINVSVPENLDIVNSVQINKKVLNSGTIGLWTYGHTIYYWIGLRNYSSVDPGYSIGAELTDNPTPSVQLNQPSINYYNTTNSVLFNCTSNVSIGVVNLTLVIDGINNYTITNSSANQNLSIQTTLGFIEGLHNWTCDARTSANVLGTQNAKYFIIDRTPPTANIIFPTNTTYSYGFITSPTVRTSINWTCSDLHPGTCILFNGTTNTSVLYGTSSTYVNLSWGSYWFTLFANDTHGNNASYKVAATFQYVLNQNSITYTPSTLEGNVETFSINVTLGSGRTFSSAYLIYNGTSYPASYYTSGPDTIIYKNIEMPDVSAVTNKTFLWSINLDTGNVNSSDYIQTINPLSIDNCTVYSVKIFNFTLKDEQDQSSLGSSENTSIELDLQIKSTQSTSILNYSGIFNSTNPVSVCLNINLSNSAYRVDGLVRYVSGSRVPEFYNLQNLSLKNTTIPQNINLYDLKSANSQEFLITFKDNSFLPVENALIQIQRKYISEGVFKVVEIPKTDKNGQAIAHFDLNGVIYNIIIIKDGNVLAVFDNIAVVCENAVIGNCKINLNAFSSGTQFTNYSENKGLVYSIAFNKATRKITVSFTTASGQVSTVRLNATKFDRFGNTSVCSDSVSSAGGSLICDIPGSYGNVTVIYGLYNNDELVTSGIYSIIPEGKNYFGNDVAIMNLMIFMTIPFMFFSSVIMFFIAIAIGFILSAGLFLLNGFSWIGVTSFIGWIIIVIGLIVWRINKLNPLGT